MASVFKFQTDHFHDFVRNDLFHHVLTQIVFLRVHVEVG